MKNNHLRIELNAAMDNHLNEQSWGEGDSEPVFSGLRETGVTGRKIASALKISPATVSKWRRGRTPIPAEIQVFLTLMLAGQVDRLGDLYANWGQAPAAWHLAARAGLEVARELLETQEKRNRTLSGVAVCDGTRLFRVWWNADRIVSDLVVKPTALVREAALAT